MYDYVDGKVDWMAYGLPTEGDDGPFVGDQVSPVTTCDVGATVGEARRLVGDEASVVVVAGGLAVGEVDAGRLKGHDDEEMVLDLLDPVPGTYRPSVTVAAMAEQGAGPKLISTPDGRLLGAVTVEGEHHHHHDHGDGDGEVDAAAFDRQLTEVMAAVEERFGDREPSEAELRAFLHERLVAEGRSAEEADRFLDELDPAGS